MATTVLRSCRIFKPNPGTYYSQFSRVYTARDRPRSRKTLVTCLGIAAGALGAAGVCMYALDRSVKATTGELEPPSYPWDFDGLFTSMDHAALRRGWEVYRTVCATCHSLKYVAYRNFVDVTHTEAEAKAIAAEAQVQDGPDEKGEYFMRPCTLADTIPPPYPNERAARAANGGSFPVDLTYVVPARRNGQNYLFSLLTGWMDPPAGIDIEDGQAFNVYFPGGAIGMPSMIYDGVIEYEDGTQASHSQIAKDLVAFLVWTSSPEFDTRKVLTIKAIALSTLLVLFVYHMKRFKFATLKSRRISYVPKQK